MNNRLRQNDDHLLDLHGLTIAEARVVLMEGVTQWWSRSQMQSGNINLYRLISVLIFCTIARRLIQPLRIITGVGKHSEYGESKLLPMTMKFLRSEGWLFETPNPGCIMVKGIQQKLSSRKK